MESGYRNFLANISLLFAKKTRISILLFLSVVLVGGAMYSKFLQRDGFPSVEVPIAIISSQYFVNDPATVDKDVTIPIESSLENVKQIIKLTSTTTPQGSFIIAEFDDTVNSEEGLKLAKEAIEVSTNLPKSAQIDYQTVTASSVDGTHDMLFTISNPDLSIKEQQKKAAEIAEELSTLPEILLAESVDQITEETNSQTGKKFDFKSTYQRIGEKDSDGNFVFTPAVSVGIVKKNESVGTLELSEAVRTKVENLQDAGKLEGYSVNFGGDMANSLNQQIESLQENAIEGLIAVIIVLAIFVSWRASIMTAFFIPAVVSATLIALYFLGYTLNIISLFGLILVLGLLVDDATVIVEAIEKKRRFGKDRLTAIKEAVYEVGPADVTGTLATVLVFTPMMFISGVLGDFIILIPVTVIVTILFSLLFALTIIPFMSGIAFRSGKGRKYTGISKVLDTIFYGPSRLTFRVGNKLGDFVGYYISHKAISAVLGILGIVLIGLGMFSASFLKFNIFPEVKDSEELTVNIAYLPGTSIDQAEEIAKKVEDLTVKTIGAENINYATYYYGSDTEAFVSYVLTPMEEREPKASQIVIDLTDEFANFDEAQLKATSGSVGPPTSDYQFFVQAYADDQSALQKVSKSMEDFVKTQTLEGDVKVAEALTTGLFTINKKDGNRFIEVKAKLSDSSNTALVTELENKVKEEFKQERLNEFGMTTADIEFDKGQETENQESFESTIVAFFGAMILLYVLLVIQFDSLTQPALVMLAIPLAFPGLFPGLLLTDNPLSFFVMIGIIGLSGIVVNNTIMLVDFANQSRAKGMGIRESIVNSIKARFRPLVTTSVTTIAGLLPLAFTDPFWESLALSIVFGLISSMTLVVLIFPVYYSVLEKFRVWTHKSFRTMADLVN